MGKSKSNKWYDDEEDHEESERFNRERARRDSRRGKNEDRLKHLRYDDQEE